MNNITQIIKSIKVLVGAIPRRDDAGRLEIYLAVRSLLEFAEKNLDSDFTHHRYTRENLMRVEHAVSILCGHYQLGGEAGGANLDAIVSSLEPAMSTLQDPSRWPSSCYIIGEDGSVIDGTNNPPEKAR